MDGGMDSHAEDEKSCCYEILTDTAISRSNLIFSANVRSAVRVFTGEAGVTFAQIGGFRGESTSFFRETVKNPKAIYLKKSVAFCL
jgi:hypothetical protein